MKDSSAKNKNLLNENKLIVASFAISIIFLSLEPIIDSSIFKEGSFREQIMPLNDPHEIVIRSFVVLLFISFGVFAQSIINRRKRAEEELAEAGQNYRNIFYNAMDGIVATTLEGHLTTFNDAFVELTGYSRDELLNMRYQDLTPPEYHDMEAEKIRRLLETGEPQEYEKEYLRKDGTKVPLLLKVSAIYDTEGKPRLLMAVVKDMTRIKQVEEIILASEKKYRTLLEHLPQKIFHKDTNSVYVSCNENYAQDLKIKPGEIAGKTDYEFFPRELAEKYRADDKRIMESGETEEIVEKYMKDGQEFTIQTAKTPIKDERGNTSGILGIFWDITEHKRAEKQLAESEKRYRTFVETIRLGINDIDIKGNIVFANAALHKLYEYSEGELIGKSILDIVATSAERKTLSDYLKYLVKEEPPPTPYFGQNRTNKGNIIDVRVDWDYRRGPEGHLQGFTSIITDITERKQAEEQIKASLKEKEVLLSEVHHRVNNNLQIIASLFDMSRRQTTNKEAISLLQDARNRISTMSLIHSQLYRSDRFDRIDMNQHARELGRHLLQMYTTKKVTLDVKPSNVFLSVSQAIPCALVLNELVSNALQHAYGEGQKGTICISIQRLPGDRIRMCLKDDGMGIPEEVDPFKADSLGLKLVRNLVENQLGGRLQFKRNKGTEFTIEFKESKENEANG